MDTEIICIIDRSGSMESLAVEAIGGFNQFIADQKAVPTDGGVCRVTYIQFDNVYELVYEGKPIAEVPRLSSHTYKPRGMTALLDAVGRTLTEARRRIKASIEWFPPKVIVVILTDGQENASHEYTREAVKSLIAEAEKDGWSFVFLAANQDAFTSARNLGINVNLHTNATQTFDYSGAGVAQAYGSASLATTNIRTTGSAK